MYNNNLLEVTHNLLDYRENYFQRDKILAGYSPVFSIYVLVLLCIAFNFFIVIKPLWGIHVCMVNYQQVRKREIDSRLGELLKKTNLLIRQNKLAIAEKTKQRVKFLSEELAEIQKYPRWPISYLPVLRSYLSSGLLSAMVTYLISLLQISLSTESGNLLTELVKIFAGAK